MVWARAGADQRTVLEAVIIHVDLWMFLNQSDLCDSFDSISMVAGFLSL
jgi:hypothetical protein